MTRRLLAFFVVLCVLTGAIPLQAATVTLVCRLTGQPMQPFLHTEGVPLSKAAAADESRLPCCVVDVARVANGETHFALRSNSCCDMRVTAGHSPLPAFLSPMVCDTDMALMPLPATLMAPPFAKVTRSEPIRSRPSAPRAPPQTSVSLRAPPVLS